MHDRRFACPGCGVSEGFQQLPVTDGTGWIGIVDIADVCGVLLAPPAA